MIRSRRRYAVLFSALAAMVVSFALAAPGAHAARGFDTGVVDPESFSLGSSLPFERVKENGGKYAKITVFWPNVAPGPEDPGKPLGFVAADPRDPQYKFASLDQTVTEMVSAGLKPVLTVTSAPRWARSSECPTLGICTPNPSDYADFGKALAARYSGGFSLNGVVLPRVQYWQVWVEPNLKFFYSPIFKGRRPVSPDNYRGILNAFYDAVHSIVPSNIVISAGLAPLARPGDTIGPLDFMRRLLCMTGRKNPKPKAGCNSVTKLDIWATHPYTTGGPLHMAPGRDDVSLGDLPEMAALLKAADKAGKIDSVYKTVPFWATEFSWDSKPPDPGGLISTTHARWVAEAMYRMWSAGLSTMIWFQLRDDARKGQPDSNVFQSGLYFRGANIRRDKPKRVLSAFRFPFVALTKPGGILIWGRTPNSKRATLKIKHGRKQIAKIRANGVGIFTKTIRTTDNKRGFVTASVAGGETSLPFSLVYVTDFYQPPFG